MSEPTATVLNTQRMSTEDGPGLRTTVFFKGCPLSCGWCHNPESISPAPELMWFPERCLSCGACSAACPEGVVALDGSARAFGDGRCRACGRCVEECPGGARELLGQSWGVGELLDQVQRDRAYWGADGGVTLSGGEPAAQPAFAEAFLRGCRERGLHTALDTCGLCPPAVLERLLPHADLVLYDLKLMDPEAHARHTGQDNRRILDNLLLAARGSRALWVRTPLIPGVTDSTENLTAIGGFISGELDGAVRRWELCAFHNTCAEQYRRLGQEWSYASLPLLTPAELQRLEGLARRSGVAPELVRATGPTRSS